MIPRGPDSQERLQKGRESSALRLERLVVAVGRALSLRLGPALVPLVN